MEDASDYEPWNINEEPQGFSTEIEEIVVPAMGIVTSDFTLFLAAVTGISHSLVSVSSGGGIFLDSIIRFHIFTEI